VEGARESPAGIPIGFWWKVLPAFGAAALIAAFLPRTGSGGVVPPAGTLLLGAALVGLVTTAALYAALRLDLGLPVGVAAYAVLFNLLVVAVKFGLAPHGMYEVNQRVELESLLGDDLVLVASIAAVVFCLYGGALTILYRVARGGLERRPDRVMTRRSWGVAGVVAVLLLATTGGGIALALPLLLAGSSLQYLSFVFSSSVSLLVALALGFATALAALAFRDLRGQAAAVGDAAVLVSFFWIALAFLALYHVLWVVYVLALTATWPLRVVVPK
jgi:hypothetical protein